MPKSLFNTAGYKKLVKNVTKEFADLEFFLKNRTAKVAWTVGKYVDEHILEYRERAGYGAALYIQLAEDVDRDVSTLQRMVQFYRAYPNSVSSRNLTLAHYQRLITVRNKDERKKLEVQVIKKKWSAEKLQQYLNTKRHLEAPVDDGKPLDSARGKPVPQLTFTRGRLNIYQIVAANKTFIEKSPLVLDLGFREQYLFPKNSRPKENEIVELVWEKGEFVGVKKSDAASNELFTYQAKVEKVVDGDTLLVSFEFNLEVSISQKLRLRGIDCPEMDTEEGKKAKRFVESRLKGCEFIIVKTYKDRTDNWDRYLADVFYGPRLPQNDKDNREAGTAPRPPKGGAGVTTENWTPAKVADEGIYLNQELLDNHLAVIWK